MATTQTGSIGKTPFIEKLGSKLIYAVYALLIITIFSFMNQCSNSKKLKKITVLEQRIDSLISVIPNQKVLELQAEKRGFEISRRMLVDNNSVVRTTKRPDDIMNEYNKEIERIDKELAKVK